MASHGAGLLFNLIAHDGASPAFLKVASAADKAAASTARAQKSTTGASAVMARKGALLTKRLSLPLAAAAAVSVHEAAKYQKSMTLIGTVTDQTSKQMAGTSKGLLKIAKDTGTNLEQLSDGLYTVEKGGLRGSKALATVKAAAQGAKAEGTDLATTTNALTSIMASYGSKLGNPVAAMNMLIKGSGLAKTTMQDFAGSLSNVVPVASSLGIGFDQVAGAIATMTQHGESAQHATDNLRNLITNLAGQNNVASASLQQLGVDTVDLSKNLGRRGLTGSLDLVLDKIAKHSKAGLIVTSSFRKAATATASVRDEIAHMPKMMQANSKAFDKGTMSYKDYLAYAKSLGGQQFAMAKQFLGTENTAKGFNRQLQSGNSRVRTLASTLQKSLGGVTGMNVALQLSGESAHRFHEYVDEIGHSAKRTKGDVLGWGNTQSTLAVKLDKAKASLQVMAVEIGTALIPAVSKIVDWVGKGVHAFDGLSGTQKKVLAWSAGVLFALGPVLTIGSRLATVARGMGAWSRIMSGFAAQTASRTQVAMTRIGTAIAGIGLVTAGMQTKGKGGAIMAALGGGLTGASIGSFFGPLGTAIGGVAGTVAGLGAHFLGIGDDAKTGSDKAKAALAEQKAAADDLLASLKSVGGQYGANYKSSVVDKIQGKGGLKLARLEGVKGSDLTAAVMGDKSALARIQSRLAFIQGGGLVPDKDVPGVMDRTASKAQIQNVEKLRKLMGSLGISTRDAEQAYQDYIGATGKAFRSDKQFAVGLTDTKNGLKQFRGEFAGTARTFDKATSSGLRNSAMVQQNAAAIGRLGANEARHGASVRATIRDYAGRLGVLRSNLHQLGFNDAAVGKLIGSYRRIPKSVVTELKKRGATDADIARYARMFGLIPSSKTTTLDVSIAGGVGSKLDDFKRKVNAATSGRTVKVSDVGVGFAKGTPASGLPRGLSSVGENGPELAYNDGAHTHIIPNGRSRKIAAQLGGMGVKMPGFAKGTSGNYAAIAALLRSMGATKAGIAGFLGNVKIESGGRTNAYNPNENAHGWAQWEGGRLTKLRSIAHKLGVGIHSRAAQLAMIRSELTHGYRSTLKMLRGAKSARSAAAFVDANYEVSSGSARGARMNAAAGFMRSGISAAATGKITKRRVDGKTKYEYGGQLYASRSAALNAQTRAGAGDAKDRQQALRDRVTGALGRVGQTSSPQFQIAEVGRKLVAGQLRSARKTLVQQIAAGMDRSTAKSLRSQLSRLVHLANKQLSALRVKIRGADLNAVRKGLKGTVDDTRSALQQMYTDVARLGRSTTRLRAKGSALVSAQGRLAAAKEYRGGIADTLRGAYDMTQSGSVGDFITGINGATTINKKYSAEVGKLRNAYKGNKSGTALLNFLAQSGQTATLESLAAGSKADQQKAAKAYGDYSTSITAGSNAAELAKFGKSIETLSKDQADTLAAVSELAHAYQSQPIVVGTTQLDRHIDARTKKALDKVKSKTRHGRNHR